LEEMHTC